MGKDEVSERDSSSKKRRKTTITETIKQEEDIYKRVITFEETEACNRSAEKDAILYCKTCDIIRSLLAEILELKKSNNDEAKSQIAEKRIQVSLQFVLLKKLNRLEKIRTKVSRDALHKEKQRVDSTQLQLHNLLYELEHLKKEITKCLQFKSKDEEIDLVPVDEFYKQAPESISRPDITKTDDHQLRLARLEWELSQRKKLSELCQKLQTDKTQAASQIVSKQERLDGLAPRLNHVLEVTKPLQEYLGLPMEKIRKQNELASLLPDPLFLLFYQMDAYKQVYDKNATVIIIGDEDEARQIRSNSTNEISAEWDSDQEGEDGNEHSGSKRHHRKSTRTDRQEERRSKLLAKHPLSVQLSICLDKQKLPGGNDSPVLRVTWYYLRQLHIVTIKCDVNMNTPLNGISAGDVISNESILTELFLTDTGNDSPNTANHYQLKQAGLGKFSSLVKDLGRPYVWAQRACGLDFVSSSTPNKELSQFTVEVVMKAIRNRFRARIFLYQQIQSLEKGSIIPQPEKGIFELPEKIRGTLEKWTSITWSEYLQSSCFKALSDEQHITENDMLYQAVISRNQAKLIIIVVLKNDFPLQPPIFSVVFKYNNISLNAGNSDAIRDIERTVNTDWQSQISKPGWAAWILCGQLKRLMACFDVYLETTFPNDFPQEKIYFKPARGRNRSRPYKYLQIGGGIFTQF